MTKVINQQANRKRSVQWLNNERGKCKEDEARVAIDEARVELETMGWNTPLTYGQGTTSTVDLQEFLSTVWLRRTHINIMMEDLAAQVVSDPELVSKVVVATLSFSENAISDALKGEYTKRKSPLLHGYEGEVKEKEKEKIVFPANVGNSHWIAGEMDFQKKVIGFGDSLPGYFRPPE
ncbi:hypothetical protein B0H11DRAFT_576934 [Mycena galericulata]|nr:hypothetical protein B0H11DRAFT_576934 [Mycena galericulata]